MANTYRIYTSENKALVENVSVTLAEDDKTVKKWIEKQGRTDKGYVKLVQTEN